MYSAGFIQLLMLRCVRGRRMTFGLSMLDSFDQIIIFITWHIRLSLAIPYRQPASFLLSIISFRTPLVDRSTTHTHSHMQSYTAHTSKQTVRGHNNLHAEQKSEKRRWMKIARFYSTPCFEFIHFLRTARYTTALFFRFIFYFHLLLFVQHESNL